MPCVKTLDQTHPHTDETIPLWQATLGHQESRAATMTAGHRNLIVQQNAVAMLAEKDMHVEPYSTNSKRLHRAKTTSDTIRRCTFQLLVSHYINSTQTMYTNPACPA